MRTGIITLHRSYSYGACLQAYATYLTIKKLGHDPVMIDYSNEYEQCQNQIISKRPNFSILKNLEYTLENILLLKRYNMKKAFNDFHNIYVKTDRFTSLLDLQQNIDKENLDCIISGSDQLWNPDIFNGLDTAYLLDFGSDGLKRIAYAASAGSHIYTEEEINIIKPLLKRYNAISVRETKLKEQLNCCLDIDIELVLDPTFLLSPQEWLDFANGVNRYDKQKYILLYMIGVPFAEYKILYAPIVRYYAQMLNTPVYAINPMSFVKLVGANRNITDASPKELINLINGAELIITSSFHGVAFSVSLNKPFIALKTSNFERINNLLSILNLNSRSIDSYDETKCRELLDIINYDFPNQQLKLFRETSREWLKYQLI